MLFDGLARLNNEGLVELHLAESVTPDAQAKRWTIKIPAGITTHKGKPFTSDDVLYSLKRIVANKTFGSGALGPINIADSRVVDATTVEVHFDRPYSIFLEGLAIIWNVMVPRDFDPKDPDGTGPFMYQSFTPGVSGSFVKNPNYWGDGPYLDKIVITELSDETAQVNALRSGQVDLVNGLSASSVAVLKGAGSKVYLANRTGNAGLFTMRVDSGPFADVRVRQAMTYLVDRQQMIDQVFGGYGTVGNDAFGFADDLYNTDMPQREHDLSKAKSLLAGAGRSDLQLELVTAPNGPGSVQAAQVLATQAKAAGVDIRVKVQTPTDYFATSYLNVPFSQDQWPTFPYLTVASLALGPNAPYNPSHQSDPEYNKLLGLALATTDNAAKEDYAHGMQLIEHDRGGNMIPYYFPGIDASSSRVHGLEKTASGLSPCGLYWAKVWLES